MSSETSPTAENEALLAQIGALEKEVAATKVAMRRASLTRLVLLLLVLGFLALSIWMFARLAMEFVSQDNLDKLQAKATERIEASREPAMRQLRQLVDTCTPLLKEAFSKQAQADMPKYTKALEEEREVLVKNLQSRLSERINARYKKAGERYQAILREEFPQVQDPDLIVQMYGSLEQIMEKLVAKYYTDQLRQEVEGVCTTWQEFEMAELPAADEPPLEQQFLATMMQIGGQRLEETEVNLLELLGPGPSESGQ